MTSAFFGLDLALRALQAQQMGIDVTNHNVANANTEGFSRQNLLIATTDPFAMPAMNRPQIAGQLGTGAIARDVQRARDLFLDAQYRVEAGALKHAETRQDALEQVEVLLDEPQGVGLSQLFNEYFRVWNELANDPGDLPVRTTVVQQALSLTGAINRIDGQLTDVRVGLDREVITDVAEVNDITDQILRINTTIAQVEMTGQSANDFRDHRDALLDRLSELVQVSVSENANGTIDVRLGARTLVDGAAGTKTNLVTGPNGAGYQDVYFGAVAVANLLTTTDLGKAEIAGKLTARDTSVTSYQARLDTLAQNLADAVNALHQAGFGVDGPPATTGIDFFTYNPADPAGSLGVNAAIQADPLRIAASDTNGAVGNNEVALQIIALRTSMSPPLAAGTPTVENAYNALIAQLGMENRTARNETDTQSSLAGLLDRRRKSTSGVSLDEEAVSLLRYQRAYEAAARVLTAYDEILNKLINGTGIVGR